MNRKRILLATAAVVAASIGGFAASIPNRCLEGSEWIAHTEACVVRDLLKRDQLVSVFRGDSDRLAIHEWQQPAPRNPDPRCWYYWDDLRGQWLIWKCQ